MTVLPPEPLFEGRIAVGIEGIRSPRPKLGTVGCLRIIAPIDAAWVINDCAILPVWNQADRPTRS